MGRKKGSTNKEKAPKKAVASGKPENWESLTNADRENVLKERFPEVKKFLES